MESYKLKTKAGYEETWVVCSASNEVTQEILEAAEEISAGCFGDSERVNWEEFFDRLEGHFLNDGTRLSLGDEYGLPSQEKIKHHIRVYRRG